MEYQESDAIGCNWRVVAVATAPSFHEAAQAAVDHVAACNRDKWVMVADDSELAGQVVQHEATIIDLAGYRERAKSR